MCELNAVKKYSQETWCVPLEWGSFSYRLAILMTQIYKYCVSVYVHILGSSASCVQVKRPVRDIIFLFVILPALLLSINRTDAASESEHHIPAAAVVGARGARTYHYPLPALCTIQHTVGGLGCHGDVSCRLLRCWLQHQGEWWRGFTPALMCLVMVYL